MHPGEPYDPGVPEAEFGPLLRDAGAAIRESSSRPLVVGGLASGDAGYYSRTVAAAGGSLAYDAVGLHPYGQRAPDGWPDPSWGFGDMTDIYDRYLAAAGGLPLWITEVGTEDLPHQADYLRNVYALTRDSYLDRVPVVLWFCWSDAMVGHFGVLDAGGSPKDSYRAYADVAPDWDPACGATTTDADADADADAPLDGLGADDADVDAPLDGLGAEDADAPLDEPGAEDDGAGALDGADDVCDDGARDGISFDAPGWDGTAPADGGPDSPAETPSTPDDGEATGCGCAVPGGPSRAHLVLVFAALALSALHRRNGPPRRGRSS
jgi:MYXO-CTERM domain-containing protein